MYRNLFVLNTPIQYLMARLIIQRYHPEGSAMIMYHDQHSYGDAYERIDEHMGPREFDIIPYRDGIDEDLPRVERVFICNRYNPIQVALSYRLKSKYLCAFEDALGLYVPRSPFVKWQTDYNKKLRLEHIKKRFLAISGIDKQALPGFFRFSRFDEVYSVFPWVDHARKDAVKYSLLDQFQTLRKPLGDGGKGTCLILSQSMTTDGTASADFFLNFLRARIQELVDTYETVYFKPHPRDPALITEEFINTGLVSPLPEAYQMAPVELYIGNYPQTDIYGFMSSTLSYAGVLGAKAWSFGQHYRDVAPSSPQFEDFWEITQPLMERAGVAWYQP